MKITSKDIELIAPNADAAKNGRDLFNKKKLDKLSQSPDGTLIFGECAGSGKNPYYCSADYIDESSPVFRCSCPSRQIPCKHVLGLLYAYAGDADFKQADIPEDILSKRSKIEQRQTKKEQEKADIKTKAEQAPQNTKAKLSALVKKTEAQLEGITLAGKLIRNIVQTGLSSLDASNRKMINEQIKQLGNYYIPGIQTAFNDLILELENVKNSDYTQTIDQLNYISALIKKSQEYLTIRKENPETPIEIQSAIEEQIGHAWKLTELMQQGSWEEDAELAQLAFYNYDDAARREYVDEGYWINLKTGKIFKTKNYRPYKAKNYIKEENSFFDVIRTKELLIYPGDINPRIRWDDASVRDIQRDDIEKINAFAAGNYADLVKSVKSTIKNPLADKHPVSLIRLHKAYQTENAIVAEDESGNRLTLNNISYFTVPTENILEALLPKDAKGICLTVMFENNIQSGLLTAQALSLIHKDKILRLVY